MPEQTGELAQETRKHAAFVGHNKRRNVGVPQRNRQVIAALDDLAHADGHPTFWYLIFGQQP